MDDSENWQSKPYQIKKYWNPRPIPTYIPEQYQEYFMDESYDPLFFLKSFTEMLHSKTKLLNIKRKLKPLRLSQVKKYLNFILMILKNI